MPNPVDVHVGLRVRQARVASGLSQSALGELLGVTFQQIQKYEKGKNRLSASKLFETAQALGLPIDRFFEGLPGIGSNSELIRRMDTTPITSSSAGVELVGLWPGIVKSRTESVVLNVARLAAGSTVQP